MDFVITYDVNTETKAGRRRLRQIAKLCLDYGQRVQHSVFECTITPMQMDKFSAMAEAIIDPHTDSLRIYRLHGGRSKAVYVFGLDHFTGFTDTLIV